MAQLTSATATPLESVEGLGEGVVEKLKGAGISTVEALADMTPEQLEAIEGIGPKTVEKISVAVNNYFASLEGGETVALPENEGEGVSTEPADTETAPADEVSAETSEVSAVTGEENAGAEESVPEEPALDETVEPAEKNE